MTPKRSAACAAIPSVTWGLATPNTASCLTVAMYTPAEWRKKNRVCVNVRTCAFETLAIAEAPEGGDV